MRGFSQDGWIIHSNFYEQINCIKDFNKSWNYFAGLNEKELEIEIRKSVTWDRPSWKFGNKNLNHDFEKAFRQFNALTLNSSSVSCFKSNLRISKTSSS